MGCLQERAKIEKAYGDQLTGWSKRWRQLIEKGLLAHGPREILDLSKDESHWKTQICFHKLFGPFVQCFDINLADAFIQSMFLHSV